MTESRIGRGGQIKVYTGKFFRTFLHDKGWKSLISTVIIAIILSWVIGENTFNFNESLKFGTFAMICGCIWTGLFNSIQSVCRERAIIKREHRTGLHISAYVTARMLFELVLCAVEGIIMTVVFDIFHIFPETGAIFPIIFIEFFITFTLIIFCSDALGVLVSCVVKTENAAMTVMPFVLIIQLVMSGMLFQLPEAADPVKQFTISKWGQSALCISSDVNSLPSRSEGELIEATEQMSAETIEALAESAGYSISDAEKEAIMNDEDLKASLKESFDPVELGLINGPDPAYDSTASNLFSSWGILVLFSCAYGIIGIIFLKRVDKDKR